MEHGPGTGSDDSHSPDRWHAAISYVSVVCLVPFFLRSENPYILYHAKQGVVLFLVEMVGAIFIWILDVTFGQIPFLGILLVGAFRLVFFLLALGLSVLGFMRALAGERLPLPWLGTYAEGLPNPPFHLGD